MTSLKQLIPGVKNVVAVASGKGGVGKSTVSANLAVALAKKGLKVGLMDADVYGPSIPTILGITEKPVMHENRIVPVEKHGVKVVSIAFFVPAHEAVIWRGPMLHKMVNDFLGQVEWGELDYLIVDLPPGTGDIQLSLCQSVPLTGALIVSTPQDLAWNVAQKAIVMFDKLNTPVLGIIENMSQYVCEHCGKSSEIFGRGGAKKAAELLGISYLGEIPLVKAIRAAGDEGKPLLEFFASIAEGLTAAVALQAVQKDKTPIPIKIDGVNESQIRILWNDAQTTTHAARDLRLACPCAACVNEVTGERRLKPESVPTDVKPLSIQTVGRYALHIAWSDGHNTGLYGFQYLRKL